ncbi:MAG: sulfotransferase family 2 domain-containing protein [Pyrinomonadaceae bacterium]|nr:sulfotransferase family 2 domain-containing protein [Pyrinomonadaceae bacterium]
MIVSFKHSFIFIAIPKTATHSFRTALRPHLGKNDWEQCVLFEKKFFPVEAIKQIGHGHISCQEIRPFLLPDVWNSYFRFCTVRNPYDRFVSFAYFMNRANQRMKDDPLGTMKKTVLDKQSANKVLFRPQHEFVTDQAGQLLVDFICRFESLQKDFDHVCDRLKLPKTDLPTVNTAAKRTDHSHYDQELKEMVQSVFQKDFDLFNYGTDLEENEV